MAAQRERILVVESDPEVSDLIARQALEPLGYQIKLVSEASQAIREAARFAPDLVIANLELPALSGKDLLVALSAQNINIPVIVIASQGMESDIIQAFRLGASDYLSAPLREAELVSAVERALKTVRARRERRRLARQLQQTNGELRKRVRELNTIFSVGKAVTSITDQKRLFARIIEAAVSITEADLGWLLVRDERTDRYLLRAHQNLPASLSTRLNKAWDDGISALVGLSGEALTLHGLALGRFKVASMGRAALVMPVKVQNLIVALMVVMREQDKPFMASDEAMLDAVSDYAAISLVNARLFLALDERAASLQAPANGAQKSAKDEIIQQLGQGLRAPLDAAAHTLNRLRAHEMGPLEGDQIAALQQIAENLQRSAALIDSLMETYAGRAPQGEMRLNLNDLANQDITRFQTVVD